MRHIAEEVAKDLGYDPPIDILCGTSVGAFNASMLAAWADEPRGRVARLAALWTGIRLGEILQPKTGGMYDIFRALLGRRTPLESGALFASEPIKQLLTRGIPFERIDAHLRAGLLHAVTVSTTQIATGRTFVFAQRREATPEPWQATRNVVAKPVRLRVSHALASAAVPLLFPAVKIGGRYYCDGGIRQNIPLSPARRLGAQAVIIINPRYRMKAGEDKELERAREEAFPSPLFVLGKTLNALTLDRIDNEIDRLEKVNEILAAGTRRFGPGFGDMLNEELGYPPGGGLRKLHTVHIRTSENIGALCAEYVRSPKFDVPGVLGRVMQQLADGEAAREADLLSYLCLDGEFLGQLIELGCRDARQHHDSLCNLFESVRLAGPH